MKLVVRPGWYVCVALAALLLAVGAVTDQAWLYVACYVPALAAAAFIGEP